MPTQDRRGRDRKRRPPGPREHPRQQSQHRPIRGLKIEAAHLTAQHLDLMPQDRDLHLLRKARAEAAAEHVQDPPDQQVPEAARHKPTLLDATRVD
jgi:hypothetical protein